MYTINNIHPHDDRAPASIRLRLPSFDTLGMVASTICLVHCLVVPLVLMLLPMCASQFAHDDRTHYLLAGFVATFCLLAVVPGYVRHSNKTVLWMMISGLALVLFATFAATMTLGQAAEIPVITVGNLLVLAAHRHNRKLLACC